MLVHSLTKCCAGTEPTLPGHLVPVAQLEPGEAVPEVEGTSVPLPARERTCERVPISQQVKEVEH